MCTNENWDGKNAQYFDFKKYNTLNDLKKFFNGISSRKLNCGIVVRIPNPSYKGSSSKHKNASFRGEKEMLWSDIKRIKVSIFNDELSGIGF